MDVELKLGYSGEFRCILYNEDMSIAQDTGWFPNTIVDNGLDLLGGDFVGTPFTYMCIGSGTTAPTETDTQLETFTAVSSLPGLGNAVDVWNNSSPFEYSSTMSRRFVAGDGTGTVAELSTGRGADGTNIFNRSLITPSPINKGASQQLDVIYRLTIYPSIADSIVNGVDFGGILYNTVTRGANFDSLSGQTNVFTAVAYNSVSWTVYDGDIGLITELPSGNQAGCGFEKFDTITYVPLSHQLDVETTVSIGSGNTATDAIQSLYWRTNKGPFQTSFKDPLDSDAPIPKDNTKEIDFNYRLSWARH